MRYTVNIADIENALIWLGGEARAKQIQDRILHAYCEGKIPENYQDDKSFRQTIQRKLEDYCPQAKGFDPVKRAAKFIRISHGLYRRAAGASLTDFPAIEEVDDASVLLEGAKKTISVNAYERNQLARALCVKHHGYSCKVCDFNFERAYGELGAAFIHVHHVTPLAEIQTSYVVDPVRDLVPLCANCHAMVHRVSPPLSVEQLRAHRNPSSSTDEDSAPSRLHPRTTSADDLDL